MKAKSTPPSTQHDRNTLLMSLSATPPTTLTLPADEIQRLLNNKLLPLGGTRVLCHEPHPHDLLIVDRGQLFTQPIKKRRGQPNRCHRNAVQLWAKNIAKHQLITGYALARGIWRSHSWVVAGNKLHETTVPCERYFGTRLEWCESLQMLANVHLLRTSLEEDVPVIELWNRFPDLQDLATTPCLCPNCLASAERRPLGA